MYYADTSALVKLIAPEIESEALRAWLGDIQVGVATSDLARTELLRAVGRADVDDAAAGRARDLLTRLTLLSVSSGVLDHAGVLAPADMRSLDAVHLASALALGDDLRGILTYDARMAGAARKLGMTIIAPG